MAVAMVSAQCRVNTTSPFYHRGPLISLDVRKLVPRGCPRGWFLGRDEEARHSFRDAQVKPC